jgi:large subunit ribosomal protein L25
VELKVYERSEKPASLRARGYLPAVVYDKQSNRPIYVERKAFDRVFRQASTNSVVTLSFEGGEQLDTMVKAVSMDKRRRVPEHADFYIVTDEPVEVSVPVHVHGEARGVREEGGVLDLVLHSVTVRASPKRLPNEIVVEVSELGINEPLHARDLSLPEGVALTTDPDLTVVTVHPPRAEEEVAARPRRRPSRRSSPRARPPRTRSKASAVAFRAARASGPLPRRPS